MGEALHLVVLGCFRHLGNLSGRHCRHFQALYLVGTVGTFRHSLVGTVGTLENILCA